MKRRLLTLATALLVGVSAFGQLADGSVAPNFTVTDINGNSHTLYDYLDQGYTVVMDLNATWCGPCWSYHESGALEELWADHGPEGQAGVNAGTTNDVIVFMIESDGSTTNADLTGTGANTYGDWTAGVDFIIVDDASVANAYNLAYYPTIFTVCPSRILTESGPASAAAHYSIVGDCVMALDGLNAGIVSYEGDVASCGGGLNVSVNVQNLGTDNLTSFDIEVYDGGSSIGSESFSGNLSTYDVTTIDFGVLPVTGSSIEIGITTTDVNTSDNILTQNIAFALTDAHTEVTVTIETDAYGSETTWEITNAAGTALASGGPYNDLTAVGTAPQTPVTVTLDPNECHTFTILDSYGDGINAGYGEGSYTIVDGNGTTLASGGAFEDIDVALFETGAGAPTSINEEVSVGLNIYPNPTSTTANVVFTLGESAVVTAALINVLGETVKANAYQLNAGSQNIGFDVTDVTAGVYFLQLDINGQTTTQKITVTK